MISFLVDTNILLDLLTDRKPFSDHAEVLFEFSVQKKVQMYVSAISFNNLYFIINKIEGHKKALGHLIELSKFVTVISLDIDIIYNALYSRFADFEDAIQYYSALTVNGIDGIVTRNSKDFKKVELAILSPEAAIKLIGANKL